MYRYYWSTQASFETNLIILFQVYPRFYCFPGPITIVRERQCPLHKRRFGINIYWMIHILEVLINWMACLFIFKFAQIKPIRNMLTEDQYGIIMKKLFHIWNPNWNKKIPNKERQPISNNYPWWVLYLLLCLN